MFCEHCKRLVSHPTFYRHKAKYYNEAAETWSEAACSDANSDSEVEIDVAPTTSFDTEELSDYSPTHADSELAVISFCNCNSGLIMTAPCNR